MEREESFPTWHCDVPTKQAQKTIPNPPQDKWGGGKEAVKVGREWWGGKTEWEQWRKRRLKRKRRRARESDREKKVFSSRCKRRELPKAHIAWIKLQGRGRRKKKKDLHSFPLRSVFCYLPDRFAWPERGAVASTSELRSCMPLSDDVTTLSPSNRLLMPYSASQWCRP